MYDIENMSWSITGKTHLEIKVKGMIKGKHRKDMATCSLSDMYKYDVMIYQTLMNWGMLRSQVKRFVKSLTSCWPKEKIWWDCLSQNVHWTCHLQAVDHKENMWLRWDWLSQMSNVTHLLLVIRKRCDEIAFHKMSNVTYILLVRTKNVMRLPFTKCTLITVTHSL